MLAIQIFAWISYFIIVMAAVIIIYEFLEERIPIWRKSRDGKSKHP